MKKLLFALLAALALISVCLGSVAFADADVAEQDSPEATDVLLGTEQFVQKLCDLNKAVANADKTADEAAARGEVREFILGQMRLALGNDTPRELVCGKGDNGGFNIEGKLDVNGTDKCIVIGAHYDAVGEGAIDNAAGVAVLIDAAKTLADKKEQLPFDVYFVAFDCEESYSADEGDELVGSRDYVDYIGGAKGVGLDNVLVMFNVDTIAVGNLYLHCENKRTDLADLFLSCCDALSEKPYSVGVYGDMDMFGYGYYESIQGSDHTSFRLAGIPTALLFAGDYGLMGYESDSVINTSDDTYKHLVQANPDYASRISEVSRAITSVVLDERFESVAQNARGQLVNNNAAFGIWWPRLAVLGVLIVLAVFTWLYHRKLQKQAILGTSEVKNDKVFDKPAAEDIFSFDNSSGSSDKDNVDDIFTFKK